MAKSYSYEVRHYSNGEVSWTVFYREGADTFIPGGAMGFGHVWAAPSYYMSRPRGLAASIDAECQAFDAVMARCQWPEFPNAPRAA